MKPCLKPKLSITTFTTGTRQFVVHEAFEITTFLAPAVRCFAAASRSVKRPVLSSTSSTPRSFQGSFSGSLMAETLISRPLTTSASPFAATVPGKRPWTESYVRRCASVFVSVMSFTATNSRLDSLAIVAARRTLRPIRPKPLIPTRTAMSPRFLGKVRNDGASEGDAVDRSRPCLLLRPRRLGERGTSGEDVVDQDVSRVSADPGAAPRGLWPRGKGPRHVRQARLRCQRRLRRRLP